MKDRLKKLIDKLKTLTEAWKIWLFFIALIGTNGGQQIYYHEPEPIEKVAEKAKPPQKTIIKQIIYKTDEPAVRKLIETELKKHYESSRH